VKLRCSARNAQIYGARDRINFICGNFFHICKSLIGARKYKEENKIVKRFLDFLLSNKGTSRTVSQNLVFFLVPIDRESSIYSCKFSAFLARNMKLKSYGASKFTIVKNA